MIDNSLESERELAQWLVEAGRRVRRASPCAEASISCPVEAPAGAMNDFAVRRLLLFGLLATAYFQYFYLDTMLEIASLRSVIVFVLDTATLVPAAAGGLIP